MPKLQLQIEVKSLTLHPLTFRSDYHVTSPYNIHTLSSKKVTRTLKPMGKKLFQHQILEGRITCNNQILGVKGLNVSFILGVIFLL